MLQNKLKENGMSLLEVVIALSLLAVILAPVLTSVKEQAKISEDTEKLFMANRILQSIKEEITAVKFRDFWEYTNKVKPNSNGEYDLDDMFWPHTKNEVLRFQQKYRDFEVYGTFKYVKRSNEDKNLYNKSIIYYKIYIKWDQPNKGKQVKTYSNILVEPKS